jgi:hypothetical protein
MISTGTTSETMLTLLLSVPAVRDRWVEPQEEPDDEETGDDNTRQEPGYPGRK